MARGSVRQFSNIWLPFYKNVSFIISSIDAENSKP